jgi:hypothetical protein
VLKPVLQALVLADHVYQDKLTGKMVIAGTFGRAYFVKAAAKQPAETSGASEQVAGQPRKLMWHEVARAGSPFAYISLTEIRGVVPIELRFVDLEENIVLIRAELSVTAKSPLDTAEFTVPLPPLPIPHAGIYALELLTNDEPLGALRVTAIEGPGPNQKAEEEQR